MSPNDRAISVTFSLYENQHINRIKNEVKKNKKFKTEASLIQHMVDSYFNRNKKILRNYIFFPVIITGLMLYVALATQNLNNILIGEGYYFNELYIQMNIFYVIGFACLGITIAGFTWVYSKLKGE
jgi:hypothetical protein